MLMRGFSPDPYTVEVKSGGKTDAAKLGSGCSGGIANAPDVQLNFDSGGGPLDIAVDSAEDDTTLVINTPSGDWICDDDSGGNLAPLVKFDRAEAGVYDIWIGASSGEEHTATLKISGRNPTPAPAIAAAPPAAPSAAAPAQTAALDEEAQMEEHWKAYLSDIQSRGIYQNWSGPPRDLYDANNKN
jgi:hypothetical protein